jgi:hypothetical protein
MPELESALRQLGASVEFPDEPDFVEGVRRRMREAPGRGWAPPRLLLVGFAVLAVAVGAVMAVPPARTAVLEWLGIKGVSVTRVETLPKTGPLSEVGLGEQVTLAGARRVASWLVEPSYEGLGLPDHVFHTVAVPGGQVAFLWGTKAEPRLLMTQSPGRAFGEKMLGPGSDAERADVDGELGVWFSGPPHVFIYRDEHGDIREETARLAGNTLLWQHGELTVRLEGELSRREALEIARTVR